MTFGPKPPNRASESIESEGAVRTSYPPVAEVLPHKGPMVLLSAVLEHTADSTTCLAEVREHAIFAAPNGLVPSWVGIEYMAQCIAAHRGLHARIRGEPIQVGFLIGAKRVDFHTPRFSLGQVLEVWVRRLWGDRGLGAFACSILDERSRAVLVEGNLNVFLPDTIEPFMPREGP